MPRRTVKAKLSGYKSKRGQGVRRTRKNTILAKAKKAKAAKKNAKLVKSYQRAKLYRQPTLGLPDSQVVRMSFAITINHPGFVGIDSSNGLGRYTWLDWNKSHLNVTGPTAGPFTQAMGIVRANDIGHCLEYPTVLASDVNNRVSQFNDFGKFYRTFKVLGSQTSVTYRYTQAADSVTEYPADSVDEKHYKRCPPVLLWMTQHTGD